jgi:hypothetical protein
MAHLSNIPKMIIFTFGPTSHATLVYCYNLIFAICLNFQQQNPLKNQCHAHPSSKNCEINSIKSTYCVFFSNNKNAPKFQYSFLFQFYLFFIEKMVQ